MTGSQKLTYELLPDYFKKMFDKIFIIDKTPEDKMDYVFYIYTEAVKLAHHCKSRINIESLTDAEEREILDDAHSGSSHNLTYQMALQYVDSPEFKNTLRKKKIKRII